MKVLNQMAHMCNRLPSEYGRVPKGDIVKTGPNTYQTHRYRIEVTNGEVKVFDLKTKTSIRAWGDPHLHTSDGDKMQFHKNNVTIDLEDGTKLTPEADPAQRAGHLARRRRPDHDARRRRDGDQRQRPGRTQGSHVRRRGGARPHVAGRHRARGARRDRRPALQVRQRDRRQGPEPALG